MSVWNNILNGRLSEADFSSPADKKWKLLKQLQNTGRLPEGCLINIDMGRVMAKSRLRSQHNLAQLLKEYHSKYAAADEDYFRKLFKIVMEWRLELNVSLLWHGIPVDIEEHARELIITCCGKKSIVSRESIASALTNVVYAHETFPGSVRVEKTIPVEIRGNRFLFHLHHTWNDLEIRYTKGYPLSMEQVRKLREKCCEGICLHKILDKKYHDLLPCEYVPLGDLEEHSCLHLLFKDDQCILIGVDAYYLHEIPSSQGKSDFKTLSQKGVWVECYENSIKIKGRHFSTKQCVVNEENIYQEAYKTCFGRM